MGLKLKHIVPSEKATLMIDSENKLQFIVDLQANKREIASEVERVFEASVRSVRTMLTFKGEKKAIIELEEEGKAKEVATSLGVL
ncbi:50S ribosomal protein L23 [ANME-1 cluster archaeon ex4572_4]|nr:50S ribosomal protein L23 [Methanophagales archaeon]OYT66491.1 MAG: 50S ribosomal protein L23 [ANME-1 cluster archaeon ex4572_4]PXF50424.1 MAG: 50S ribosomal protein L23 [Methanophagales archaeon]HDN68100.1 50S ribosomal protein L23 [Methanomicrobia archaeon]